jgi:hypothetical protein
MNNLKIGERVIAYGAVRQLDGPVVLGPTKGTVSKITDTYILICADYEPGEKRIKYYRAHPKQCRRLKPRIQDDGSEPTSAYVNQDYTESKSATVVMKSDIKPTDIVKLPVAHPPVPKRLSKQILLQALQYANSSLSHKPWMELMIEKIEELTKVKVIDEEKMDPANYHDYNC